MSSRTATVSRRTAGVSLALVRKGRKSGKRSDVTVAPAKGGAARRPADTKLPAWGELAPANAKAGRAPARGGLLETVSTARFAFLIMTIAAAFTLYVGHVHATQDLLADVQQLRKDNLRLHLKYNRMKGEFDRVTGPAVVYERARAMGLEENVAFGPKILVQGE